MHRATWGVAASAGAEGPGKLYSDWNCLPKFSTASSDMVEEMSGVQIGPGATAFARMPLSARICASPAVKFWIAPLVGLLEQTTTARIYPHGSPGDLNESDF